VALRARKRQGQAAWVDPRLWSALVWSAAGHVLVVVTALLAAWIAPAPNPFDLPAGPMVDLMALGGDSAVMKVGPLAKKGGGKVPAAKKPVAPSPEVKPAEEPRTPSDSAVVPPPPKPEPKPEVKPEPKPVPKPEPKPSPNPR